MHFSITLEENLFKDSIKTLARIFYKIFKQYSGFIVFYNNLKENLFLNFYLYKIFFFILQ